MSESVVILVHSTSHAIHAERILKRAGLPVRLIPTPRHLSSDCGSAIRIDAKSCEECEVILADSNVQIDRIELLD